MNDQERRRFGRYPCRLRVRFASARLLREQSITNIGDGGIFVETLYPLLIGAAVDLEMLVGDDPSPLKVRGEVIWVRNPSEGGTPGMGIRFLEMPRKVRERIDRFLKPAAPSTGD